MLHTGSRKKEGSAVDELRANGAAKAVLILGILWRWIRFDTRANEPV